jgi:Domain of unknown function (DUF6249)
MTKAIMKKLILLCICSMALVTSLFGQAPTTSPAVSPPTTTPTATAATSISPSDLADRIQQKLERKLRGHHGIIINGGDHEGADLEKSSNEIPAMVIPLVGIVFLSIFGAPVLIVMMIGLFALLISRMRQRTIRTMVEKGQPIPAELLAPATGTVRRRSDLRRGVVWAMIGLGAMVFFGAVNDWENGVWSLGLIPFLIGLGYLIVWKLETKKDNPPPAS